MATTTFRTSAQRIRGVAIGASVPVRSAVPLALGLVAIVALTTAFARWLPLANATTVALSYLLVVLFVAAASPLWAAVAASVSAILALNFFFLPPIGSLAISDPENLLAWITFLAVSLVASHLSSTARLTGRQAMARRDELARLFDLSRDVLLATDGAELLPGLAARVSRHLGLGYVALRLAGNERWASCEFGDPRAVAGGQEVCRALRELEDEGMEADCIDTLGGDARVGASLRPLRAGGRTLGLLGVAGRPLESDTARMLANLVAIAIDRAHLVEARKQAEIQRRGAELQSALLASLAHDLRTPLTAIRVAAGNLTAPWLTPEQRSDQADVVLIEVRRLERLFHNIIEMARIEGGAIVPDYQWVWPSQITEAARSQVDYSLREHRIALREDPCQDLVRVDPRLTSAALAHILENAAQYSPPQSTITVTCDVAADGLHVTVQDEGPGLNADEMPRLFDAFYRGSSVGRHASGTGMGLAITRGLLAAEGGRVWAEERKGGGARFSMFVPAESRVAAMKGEP